MLKDLARAIARALADRLSKQAIVDEGTGRNSWITICEGPGGTLAPVLAGLDLYSGIPGIALFLAAAGDALNCDGHRSCARGAVAEILRLDNGEALSSHGAYAGRPGLAYALSCLGQHFPDLRLYQRAVDLLLASGDLAETSGEIDIVNGLSGTLLACLSVREGPLPSDQRNRLLERARSLGDILVERLRSDEAFTALPGGFAHGRAGIAFALKQLEGQTGNEQAGRMARSIVSELEASADRHGDGSVSSCRGNGGIALAKGSVDTLAGLTDLQVDAQLNDCLCHGSAGLVMIRQAINGVSIPEAELKAARFLETIVRDGVRCGVVNGIETPALMDGIAGVGLAALAVATPERVPNVLTLGLGTAR